MKRTGYTIWLTGAACAAAVIIFLAASFTAGGSYTSAGDRELLLKGRNYLETLESGKVADVKSTIRAIKSEEEQDALEERLSAIDNDEVDIWSYFDDIVILGDSRADDFEYNGFLPRSKVLAALGDYCMDAEQYLDTVTQTAPHHIVFTYGMNDVDGIWNSASDFTDAYKKVIGEFQERLPDSCFYVCSIIPVNQHALDSDSDYLNIPEYNEALRSMCDEIGVEFIDLDDLLEDRYELYDTDGQHFFPDAYPLWAKRILHSVLAKEAGITESSGQ